MGASKYERCDFVIHTKKDIAMIPVEFDADVWDAKKRVLKFSKEELCHA